MNQRDQTRFYDLPVVPLSPIDPKTQIFKFEAFPKNGPAPWLDQPDAIEQIQQRLLQGHITEIEADWCRKWISDGYLILEGFFSERELDETWRDYEAAISNGLLKPPAETRFEGDTLPGRTLNPHTKVESIKQMLFNERMGRIVSVLLGAKAAPFQTIMGHKSSEQLEHSDSIHMSTYPNGYLAANWIAFEDIHPDSGPLIFHPGSHKLPYLMSSELGMPFGCGYSAYHDIYEPAIQKVLDDGASKPHYFLPKKGDVLLWHANLLHGGSKMKDPRHASRKALVCHFFAEGCMCYHDLTGMPSNLTPLDFNAKSYLEANPDVASSGGDALQHYVYYGRFEGRPLETEERAKRRMRLAQLPQGFDEALYLEANPDVAAALLDPIDHYLSHGKREGRRLKP